MGIAELFIGWLVGAFLLSIVVIFVALFIPVARAFVLRNIKVTFILIFVATFILELGMILSGFAGVFGI